MRTKSIIPAQVSPIPTPIVSHMTDEEFFALQQEGRLTIYGRLRETLRLAVLQFVSKPTEYNQNIDRHEIMDFCNANRVWRAYHAVTLVNQGFCNWTKNIMFIEGREVLRHAESSKASVEPSTLTKTWEKMLQIQTWLKCTNPESLEAGMTDAQFLDTMRRKIEDECDTECRKVVNRINNESILTNDAPTAGNYFHAIAFDRLFGPVVDHLIDNYYNRQLYCHLPGRYLNKSLMMMTSTPDADISYIADPVEHMNKMNAAIDDKLNAMCYEHTSHVGGNIEDELFGGDDDSSETQAESSMLSSDTIPPSIGIIELKTFSNPSISKYEVNSVMQCKTESQRKRNLLQLLENKLTFCGKMPGNVKPWRSVANAFNKTNHFVAARDMGKAGKKTDLYPHLRYPVCLEMPNDDDPDDYSNIKRTVSGSSPWYEIFPRQHKAVCFLFNVNSVENEIILTEVFDDGAPILLVPQSTFAMQMLEQTTVMGVQKPGMQSIYVALIKAEKENLHETQPQERWRATNRMGLAYAISLTFTKEVVKNMERLLREQFAYRFGHEIRLSKKTETAAMSFMRRHCIQRPCVVYKKPPIEKGRRVLGCLTNDNNSITTKTSTEFFGPGPSKCISESKSGLPFLQCTNDVTTPPIRRKNLFRRGVHNPAPKFEYGGLNLPEVHKNNIDTTVEWYDDGVEDNTLLSACDISVF